MGVTEAVTVSTASSVVQPVHSRPALCFMRYSWHAQLSACNAYLWKYLSGDLCLYWMQLCLQFCPGDIDLAMLPKHILPFQAFNLFWSTWKAQESGLPYIALVPFAMIFRLCFRPFLQMQVQNICLHLYLHWKSSKYSKCKSCTKTAKGDILSFFSYQRLNIWKL